MNSVGAKTEPCITPRDNEGPRPTVFNDDSLVSSCLERPDSLYQLSSDTTRFELPEKFLVWMVWWWMMWMVDGWMVTLDYSVQHDRYIQRGIWFINNDQSNSFRLEISVLHCIFNCIRLLETNILNSHSDMTAGAVHLIILITRCNAPAQGT